MKKSVLIIDNDPIYRTISHKIIEKLDLAETIYVEKNGYTAIQFLTNLIENKSSVPQIILLDIEMPVMNGWEFMDEYCKFENILLQEIDIFIVSSSISQVDKDKANTYSEIKGFISKPLTIDTLKSLLSD
ncbi:MAG TPA: response regulator [Flavobacterium sp.]|uniref:response regulator n=1 Tax=unclassified Flavobacterium TaxID=196869 RepID=UPI000E9C5833|nr:MULTISPECIES: response regulator [unclassified Flavobacterium]HBI01128.1 response regulator [Flavobacterium sp.]HRE77138.1 response regulator [Flavobacterium sp.]